MKILRIANVPNNRTGGMSRTMYMTGDELVNLGHSVVYAFENQINVRGPSKLHRFLVPRKACALAIAIADKGFDIVELHEPLAVNYARARYANLKLPLAVVFSYGLECRSREAWLHYRKAKGIKTSLISRLTTALIVRQSNKAIRLADLVVCSNATDAEHLRGWPIPDKRIITHFSGVEPDLLIDRPVQSERCRSILFLGSWIERKGILDIVEAIPLILQADPLVKFVIAGTGETKEKILAAFPPNCRESISVIPKILNKSELINVLDKCGVFILPSYFEGQPLAMIEAAARGIVSIVTDIGGHRDFIVNRKNGILVKVAAPIEIANAILELIANRDLFLHCSLGAIEAARRQSWRSSTLNLIEHYTKLVEEKSQMNFSKTSDTR